MSKFIFDHSLVILISDHSCGFYKKNQVKLGQVKCSILMFIKRTFNEHNSYILYREMKQ